jgi:hypothetical protein
MEYWNSGIMEAGNFQFIVYFSVAYCHCSEILSNPYKAEHFGNLWVMGGVTWGDIYFGFQNWVACLSKVPL